MFKLLKNKCNGCKKYKWFVKRRSIYIQPLKQNALSELPICKRCAKLYAKVK